MKFPPLLATAALTVYLSAGEFCEQDIPENMDLRISQIDTKQVREVVSHDMSNNESHYLMNDCSSEKNHLKTDNQKRNDNNRVRDSVHGCVEKGLCLQAEFLWWRASLDNLEYVINFQRSVSPDSFYFNGKYKFPDLQFDPGVRLSIGYDFGRNNWDLFVRWAYHYTDPKSSTSVSGLNAMTFLSSGSIMQGGVSNGSGNAEWKNRINISDLELGYDCFFSKMFSIRPYFGLKAAWINMNYDIRYNGSITIGTAGGTPRVVETLSLRNKFEYWGVGPQMGIEGYCHMGCGFSLYSKIGGALICGNDDARTKHTESSESSRGIFKATESNEWRQRPMAQIVLGIEWAKCFANDVLLAFNLGWEEQYWWNQNEISLFFDSQTSGDLTFTGLTGGIRFDF